MPCLQDGGIVCRPGTRPCVCYPETNRSIEAAAFERIREAAINEELTVTTGRTTETEGHRAGQTKRFIEISYYEED